MSKPGLSFKRLGGVATLVSALALLSLVFSIGSPAATVGSPASVFYAFDIVQSGGSLGQGPSINNSGAVAFVSHSPGGLYFWDGMSSAGARNINPQFTNTGRRLCDSVQLTDANQVVAQDQVAGSPPANFIRSWDAMGTDSFALLARGGNPGDYDGVFSNPSMNNFGQAVFIAFRDTATFLATTSSAGGFNESAPMASPLRPAIDDNGNVVVRTGNVILPPTPAHPDKISPIELFNFGLDTPTTIADTTSGSPMFSAVGRSPGISDDGTVIAFYGDLTPSGADQLTAGGYITNPGPGIFASIDDGSGTRRLVRMTGWQVENNAADQAAGIGNQDDVCNHNWVADTGENCSWAPELGWSEGTAPGAPFDAVTNPPDAITFSAYDVDTRVAVTHTDLGAAGIVGDTFTVAFGATPSGPSRINPAIGAQPLLFTGEKGIWTVSTTVATEINGTHNPVYHPGAPLKVAQVGDRIGGQTITDLTLNDGLGQGTTDINGARTVRPGDHQIVFWASTASGDMIIRGTHYDSDEDGLLDHWETSGIDINGDGLIDLNLPAMGASPTKRDIFLEIDWLAPRNDGMNPFQSYQPAPGVTAALAAMYAAAPALPDGVQAGITAHIDAGPGLDASAAPVIAKPLSQNMASGPLQGGDLIGGPPGPPIDVILNSVPGSVPAVPGLNAVAFQTLKDQYFAGSTASPAAADLGARELAFHYAIFGDYYDPWMVGGNIYTDTVAAASNNAAGTLAHLTTTHALPNNRARFTAATVEVLTGPGAGQVRVRSAIVNSPGNNMADYKPAWTTPPGPGDTLAFIVGSSGVAEGQWSPSPDYNSRGGNDQMVTLGGFGINVNGWLADKCVQWRTLAHELGHTLGLRHGGIDHFQYKGGPVNPATGLPVPAPGLISPGNPYAGPPYNSLMSYSWQLDCPSQGSPSGAAVSPVQSYAGAADPVFNDWANLRLDFQNGATHLGSSLWHDAYDGAVANSADPRNSADTFNILDYRLRNGGDPDLASPTATVTAPRDGKQYAFGDTVSASFTAADDVGIDRVTASLDVNGDGTVDDNETVTAVAGAGGTYTATLPPLSGPFGTRTLVITAYDLSGNTGGASRTIAVGAVAENDPPNVSLSPIGTVHEGSTAQVSASATDPEGDPITYAWSAAGATITGSGATASLSVGDGPATATVTVTVTDNHGNATAVSQQVAIDNVAPSAVPGNDGPVSEGAAFHLSLSSPTDPSAGDTAAGFAYAFDCGPGYGAFGAASSAACSTTDSGTVSVGAEIRDRDGGVREYRSSVTVNNLPPAVFPGNPQSQFWGLPVTLVGGAADPSSVDQAAGFVSSWSFGDGQSASGASREAGELLGQVRGDRQGRRDRLGDSRHHDRQARRDACLYGSDVCTVWVHDSAGEAVGFG
jgi:Bacterial Ig domain